MIWLPPETDSTSPLFDFYSTNLRSGLFSGFLTLSGFLLTALTLTVIQIKKELCEKAGYIKKVNERRQQVRESNAARMSNGLKPKAVVSYYGGLKRLGTLIWATIVLSLTTSICQLTIGVFIRSDWSATVCLVFAAATFVLLIVDLALVGGVIIDMFAHWESDAVDAEPKPK